MSLRPGSSSGRRPGSAMKGQGGPAALPPGTASRLSTGMARPGSKAGALTGTGVALGGTRVQVADRPMTQQGLGGMRLGTGTGKGPQRQVQDRTYFLGLLRSKTNELIAEVTRLRKEVEETEQDQSGFVAYEKKAEALAAEIKEQQAQLADYNTLVDKLNTDESINEIQMDYEDMKAQNDRESKALDALFEQKQQRENQIRQIDVELNQEKSMADNMVSDMNPGMRKHYMQQKDVNEHLTRQLETSQQALDELNMKKAELEEELSMSPVKQEAVRLYEQLHELEEKRDQILEETQSRGTPQEERERLLKQVKEDNQEIASMDRQSKELQEKLTMMQDDIRQLDMDIEENQGEKNQKYKELKKREETMDDFLGNFEETKAQEIERIQTMENNVTLILEHMSRNLGRFHHLPNPKELNSMKEDLNFKENEMKKSENTASGLAGESERLAQDLRKVEQLESKITTELTSLRLKIDTQTTELVQYGDLDKLRDDAEARKRDKIRVDKLGEDKVILHKRRETFKKMMQQLSTEYEALKSQLNDNETFAQLANLERKWQHHELNNFVMKEYIATKTMESDYRVTSKTVSNMIDQYNTIIQNQMSGKGGIA